MIANDRFTGNSFTGLARAAGCGGPRRVNWRLRSNRRHDRLEAYPTGDRPTKNPRLGSRGFGVHNERAFSDYVVGTDWMVFSTRATIL